MVLYKLFFTMILFLLISSCSAKVNNRTSYSLANYRSEILNQYLPYDMGDMVLLSVMSIKNDVNIYVVKNSNTITKDFLYFITLRFCNNLEIRELLNRGVSYRIVILNFKKVKETEYIISIKSCSK